jgi:hypothetical protein
VLVVAVVELLLEPLEQEVLVEEQMEAIQELQAMPL